MTFDQPSRTSRVAADVSRHAPQRTAWLRAWNIGTTSDVELDTFAHDLAMRFNTQFAMVNFFDDQQQRQYFAGLHVASGASISPAMGGAVDLAAVPGREMPFDHGWCPHVVQWQTPLALRNVLDYSRFNSNPVIDKIGIESYMGAPLSVDGIPIGTICVVDREQHPWSRTDVELIEAKAEQVIRFITQRAEPRP